MTNKRRVVVPGCSAAAQIPSSGCRVTPCDCRPSRNNLQEERPDCHPEYDWVDRPTTSPLRRSPAAAVRRGSRLDKGSTRHWGCRRRKGREEKANFAVCRSSTQCHVPDGVDRLGLQPLASPETASARRACKTR